MFVFCAKLRAGVQSKTQMFWNLKKKSTPRSLFRAFPSWSKDLFWGKMSSSLPKILPFACSFLLNALSPIYIFWNIFASEMRNFFRGKLQKKKSGDQVWYVNKTLLHPIQPLISLMSWMSGDAPDRNALLTVTSYYPD